MRSNLTSWYGLNFNPGPDYNLLSANKSMSSEIYHSVKRWWSWNLRRYSVGIFCRRKVRGRWTTTAINLTRIYSYFVTANLQFALWFVYCGNSWIIIEPIEMLINWKWQKQFIWELLQHQKTEMEWDKFYFIVLIYSIKAVFYTSIGMHSGILL